MTKGYIFTLLGFSALLFSTSCNKDKNKISDLDLVSLGTVIDPPELLSEQESIDDIGNNANIVCTEETYRWAPGNP